MYKSNVCYEHGITKIPTMVINFSERLVVDPEDISTGFYDAVENWCPMCLGQCDRKTNTALELLYEATTTKFIAMDNAENIAIYNKYMSQYLGLIDRYKTMIGADERDEGDA